MSIQHFLVDGKYLGSCERQPMFWMGTLCKPASFVFVCPMCGDAWGKAMIDNCQVLVFTKACIKHKQSVFDIPGSMWMPLEPEFTNSLCGEVLQREFLLHLDYIERKLCPTLPQTP